MVTASEINQFDRCKELVESMGLCLTVGTAFSLKDANGVLLGDFSDSKELYYYLYGYQAGFEDGKFSARRSKQMRKPLLQLMKENNVTWPVGANYATQDKQGKRLYFHKHNPKGCFADDESWALCSDMWTTGAIELPERCKKWSKTIVTRKEYEDARS